MDGSCECSLLKEELEQLAAGGPVVEGSRRCSNTALLEIVTKCHVYIALDLHGISEKARNFFTRKFCTNSATVSV